MELIAFYIIFGVLISTSILVVADLWPWSLFLIVCIAWLPLIFVGIILTIFMNLRSISSKLNT
jgi:hypothetical protein